MISPPIKLTSLFEIARPKPVPPNFFSSCPSCCSKDLKMRSNCDFGTPIPVSSTDINNSIFFLSSDSPTILLFNFILPISVNFMAFPIMLNKTCRSLTSLKIKLSGILGSKSEINSRFFCRIFIENICSISFKTGFKFNGAY